MRLTSVNKNTSGVGITLNGGSQLQRGLKAATNWRVGGGTSLQELDLIKPVKWELFNPTGPGNARTKRGHKTVVLGGSGSWVKCNSLITSGIGTGDFAFFFDVRSSSSGTQLLIGDSAGNTLFGQNGTSWFSWIGSITGSAVNNNKDCQVVWTRYNGTVYIYVDGVNTGSGASATSFPAGGTSTLMCRASNGDFPWTGWLGNFACWSGRGLSQYEVQRLYKQPNLLFAGMQGNSVDRLGAISAAAAGGPFPFYTRRRHTGGMISMGTG